MQQNQIFYISDFLHFIAKMPRCVDNFCNGCLNHMDGYMCGECKYCLDSPQRGGHNRHRKPCVFRWYGAIIVIIIIIIIIIITTTIIIIIIIAIAIIIVIIIIIILSRCAAIKAAGGYRRNEGGKLGSRKLDVERRGVGGEGGGRVRGRWVRQAKV